MKAQHTFPATGALSVAFPLLFLTAGSLRAETAPAPAPSTIYAAYVLLAESPSGRTVAGELNQTLQCALEGEVGAALLP